MIKNAVFSEDRKYRYSLGRIWKTTNPMVAFIGLNPSTADENVDDPTIRRCIRYADSWGFGGLYMVNLFAFRATNPTCMMCEPSPVGPRNDWHITSVSGFCNLTVAAWGNHGIHLGRSAEVRKIIQDPHYLTLTKSGEPGHPLYFKKDLKPLEWKT